MKIKKIIFIIILLQSNLAITQTKCIDSCMINEGLFCGTFFKVFSDSSFIRTSGCEQHQSIQVGSIKKFGDTLILKKCDLTFENFIDSIIFISGKTNCDTIDLFYYDSYGKNTYTDDDFITYDDSSEYWALNYGDDFRYSYTPEIGRFNRSMSTYEKTGSFLTKSDTYYYSNSSYLINTDKKLSLVLKGLYNWTNLKIAIPIPQNTKRINLYYSFPKEIISLLNIYSVNLKHSKESTIWSCNNKLYIIE